LTLKGFLLGLKTRVIDARYGYELGDRFRLLLYAFIRCAPRRLRRRVRRIDQAVRRLENVIAKRTVLSIFGLGYCLLDSESLRIVSPTFEEWMWRLLMPKKGDVFIDVGAHIGKYTCTAAKMVGEEGLVVAVEPHPANYAILVRNVENNNFRNVRTLKIAAYERDCKMRLFVGDVAGQHSLKQNMGIGSIEVSAKKLDSVVLDELRVGRVDWVKIDVEAAEYEALKGMIETLRRFKPKLIIETFRENMDKVVQLLENLGYQLTPIKGSESDQALYLFCRQRMRSQGENVKVAVAHHMRSRLES